MGSRNNKHLCENLGSYVLKSGRKNSISRKKNLIVVFFGNQNMFTSSKEKSNLSKKMEIKPDQTFFWPDLLDFTRNLHAKSKIASGLPEKIYNIWSTLQKLTFFPSRIFFWMLLCCCISLTKFSHKSHTVSEVKTIRPLNFQARLLYFLELQNNVFSSAKKKQPTK